VFCFADQLNPEKVNDLTIAAMRKTRHGKLAREMGIDACIKFSPRQRDDPPSDTTLSNAICALIGAVWLDSQNLSAPFTAIENLGLVMTRVHMKSSNITLNLHRLGESKDLAVQASGGNQDTIVPQMLSLNPGNVID
jgi:dsRNA-specific ribonuclease